MLAICELDCIKWVARLKYGGLAPALVRCCVQFVVVPLMLLLCQYTHVGQRVFCCCFKILRRIGRNEAYSLTRIRIRHMCFTLIRHSRSIGSPPYCDRARDNVAGLHLERSDACLLYTSPSPRDRQKSRMPSSA